jgi:hypothetical protein
MLSSILVCGRKNSDFFYFGRKIIVIFFPNFQRRKVSNLPPLRLKMNEKQWKISASKNMLFNKSPLNILPRVVKQVQKHHQIIILMFRQQKISSKNY